MNQNIAQKLYGLIYYYYVLLFNLKNIIFIYVFKLCMENKRAARKYKIYIFWFNRRNKWANYDILMT